jgi:2-aminoadipate transaminase
MTEQKDTASLTPPKSKRARNSTKSLIRELLKLASRPEIISFAGGLPSPQSFPIEKIREASVKVLETEGVAALQYSTTEGSPKLRAEIAELLTQRGAATSADEVQIVSGSQQALDLIALAYIDEDSPVAVERPTYLGALQAFRMHGPRFIELPADDEGLNPAAIGPEFRGIRFAYIMPTYQNPTTKTMSDERRRILAEKAREYDFWIIEDNPYGELWYEKHAAPSMRAYAPERTLTLGTFSKVLSPGFRLGYVAGPKAALDPLTTLKQAVDLHTSSYTQLVTAECLTGDFMAGHMPDVRKLYKTQCEAMLEAMDEFFPKEAKWVKPEGGMFIWVELPEGIDTEKLMMEALERNVAYVPGSAFYAQNACKNTLRLSFVTVPKDKIRQGIAALGDLLKEKIAAL